MEKIHNKENLLAHAKSYLAKGFSIIPVGSDKKPAIPSWKFYQDHKPTLDEVEMWFTQGTATGVAIVAGKISGLVVLDFEADAEIPELPDTVTVKTGGGGRHFYFKYPDGFDIPNLVRLGKKLIDIRSDGGYVLAPPSLHKSGNHYQWEKNFEEIGLAELPEHWIGIIQDRKAQSGHTDFTKIIGGIPEGSRNDSAAKIVGKLLRHLPENEWSEIGWPLVDAWNQKNIPPLLITELQAVFNSIAKTELAHRKSDNTALPEPIHIGELMAKPTQPVDWVVQDLLYAGSVTIISAPPKSFKTWLLLDIAIRVASGEEVFGHFRTRPTKVLFIQEEDFEDLVKKRLKNLRAKMDSQIYFWIQTGFKIDKNEHLEKLVNFIKDNNIGLVLIDSFRRVTLMAENESKDVAVFFSRLQEITRTGATVLITHHDRKDGPFGSRAPEQKMRGSSDIFAAVHGHLSVDRDLLNGILTISQNKMKVQLEIDPFILKINSDDKTGDVGLEYAGTVTKPQVQKEKAKELIINLLADGKEVGQSEIIAALSKQVGKNAVSNALKEMEKQKVFVVQKGASNKKSYHLPISV